ncbi:LysR family transcriptional regulator [Glycomyces sp. TRM65418]|uniref:LysR family transcriptional regulator n=1 Tax=Glycomyces sp. TRM65418 TaxID=2867006 RepID=UPI001CE54CD4|nr:LysR family transcriptional regulator [Glycomyces sp. TRM65418]MCC3765172.1 LysR family transcriptional regulator [Glycomyces sp. TRM65418]QZD54797.1 LysR family transcriptional regulator [Glycomyces sp. TRM65418]
MDVDTRLLRYFRAVAEEGNLTRAAARLYVSQPALTKQIRQLEERLGARLFVRSKSGMALTGPGQALAAAVPGVLGSWVEAERAVRAAEAERTRVLRIGFLASAANEKTQDVIAAFRASRPGWRVEMRQASWGAPIEGMVSGEVEAAFMRLPFPSREDFALLPLLTEPRCVAMAANHPLAQSASLRFEDLLDEPFVAAPGATGAFRDHWIAAEARGGRPVRIGAVTEHPDDWLSAIANGDGIALAPASAARYYARPDIAYREVEGIAPSTVVLAWPNTARPTPALADFIAAAREAAD